MPSTSQNGSRHRILSLALLAALVALMAAVALPSRASAASCPVTPGVFVTAWLGGSGNMGAENWTNGTPTGSCDVTIASPGSDVITMTGGFNMKSLALGGIGSTPQLIISAQSPNTNLDAQPAGITVAAGASITLTCPASPGECLGGPGGGAGLVAGSSPLVNAGTIKVDSNSGTGASVNGVITNTGAISFEKTGSLAGKVTNQGSITIANGATVTNSGSSCGDTGPFVKNDTGGTITATGTGTLSVINYEQGNGTTSGSRPIQIPCGSLKYSGTGASEVWAFGGFNLTGEMQSNQNLSVVAASNNTNVFLQSDFTNKGSITLTCPTSPADCNGGAGGGVGFAGNGKQFTNAGTFTVASISGTGANVDSGSGGTITNTGTLQFDQTARLSGTVVNKGKINIADTEVVTSSGSSCGDTGASVKNDTGGEINATGSGVLSVINYEQGAGTVSGTLPVVMPCGSLKYSGSGASKVLATGGINLSGEMQSGQELTVSGESSNTNVTLPGNFTSKGSITLTCRQGSCGGVGFNVSDKDFVNAGTFTIAAAATEESGLGANFEGTIVNTGTLQFDQTGYLGGPVTNKGKLNIANGEQAKSNGGSCGDTGASVKNDTGGSINGTGSGFLRVFHYDQGEGTTSGSAPVRIPCGSLKYSGSGASVVLVEGGGTPMTGNVAAGQTLRLIGGVSLGAFSNAGKIILDQAGSSPTLNSGTVTNTGTIETTGASANTSTVNGQIDQTGPSAQVVVPTGTKLQLNSPPLLLKAGTLSGGGTINGSVENTGGVVSPGASPGTLSLNGNYTQGAGGRLDLEIAGTGAGQFDALAVGGNANLGGTVALIPTGNYPDSSAIGDSLAILPYGGSLTGGFATTTVNPSLTCPKQLTVSNDAGAKALKAVVSSTGSTCGAVPSPPPVLTPPTPPPPTKRTCPKGKKLQKGKCVPKKCPKGKKLKKGRCVKKKKPKARSSAYRPI